MSSVKNVMDLLVYLYIYQCKIIVNVLNLFFTKPYILEQIITKCKSPSSETINNANNLMDFQVAVPSISDGIIFIYLPM